MANETLTGGSVGVFRIFGVPIRLHFTFLLLLVFLLFIGIGESQSGASTAIYILALFGSVLLHELGHALVARYFGIRTVEIVMFPIGGVSRRTFIQGVLVASAATSVGALGPSSMPSAESATTVLTLDQTNALTLVLNRLIPAEGVMPAAGTLGIAGFIDKAIAAAEHLRRPILGVLAALPAGDDLATMNAEALDARLSSIEQADPQAFDLLLQATYTGYYRHPRVLEALGGVESDAEGELQLDRFQPALVKQLETRVVPNT